VKPRFLRARKARLPTEATLFIASGLRAPGLLETATPLACAVTHLFSVRVGGRAPKLDGGVSRYVSVLVS